jgi:hypothetical protein
MASDKFKVRSTARKAYLCIKKTEDRDRAML